MPVKCSSPGSWTKAHILCGSSLAISSIVTGIRRFPCSFGASILCQSNTKARLFHFRKEKLKKIDAVALNRWDSGEYYTPADWGQGSYAKCPAMSFWQGPPKRGSSIVAVRFDRLSGSIDYIYGSIYYPVRFIFEISSLFLVLTDVWSIII